MKVVIFVFTLYSVAVSIVLGTRLTVNSETHSLFYTYTAFSKPVGLPGIHQFSAMGLLDGRMIDYFDSDHQQKVPKQDWMKERLPADYWDKGTQSRLKKQQSLKNNLDILMKRMRQSDSDSDVHVLQWMSGCEGDMQPDGSITFHRGKDIYSYDGNDFLSFDDTNKVWVAVLKQPSEPKRKWNNQVLIEVTRQYLENECMDSLSKFVGYEQTQLQTAPPPEVFMFSKNTAVESKVMLTCLATGFYPKDIILNIKRNGRVLTKEDGVFSFGVRPNEDDTFQRRDSVEILRSDTSTFTCEVTHPASRLHVEKEWDHKLPPDVPGQSTILTVVVLVLAVVVLAVVVLLAVYLYSKFRNGAGHRNDDGHAQGPPLMGVNADSANDCDDRSFWIHYPFNKWGSRKPTEQN
ncbi:LOW QUALITY PROTEIN: H-2 class I histocompatibility antigen, alpha chain-like [Micropterus salmoides]|uniref:LOW QUALITY PROTEIN: H-2 class I histocompatibility antigen, alpha chain-like n=1 Tax=Micropterus salmoides TaxID=27706 RepID=UPI0018EC6739|nr:LOW QUALITY PROTEIN: H-2 class I histocompatibility antigen, alpha chain-like [Micropterus salmoides]